MDKRALAELEKRAQEAAAQDLELPEREFFTNADGHSVVRTWYVKDGQIENLDIIFMGNISWNDL